MIANPTHSTAPLRSPGGVLMGSQHGQVQRPNIQFHVAAFDATTGAAKWRWKAGDGADLYGIGSAGDYFMARTLRFSYDPDGENTQVPENLKEATRSADTFVFDQFGVMTDGFALYSTVYDLANNHVGCAVYDDQFFYLHQAIGAIELIGVDAEGAEQTNISVAPGAETIRHPILQQNPDGGFSFCYTGTSVLVSPVNGIEQFTSPGYSVCAVRHSSKRITLGSVYSENETYLFDGTNYVVIGTRLQTINDQLWKNKIRVVGNEIFAYNGKKYAVSDFSETGTFKLGDISWFQFEVDSSGNLYVINAASLAKYDSIGTLLWSTGPLPFTGEKGFLALNGDTVLAGGNIE